MNSSPAKATARLADFAAGLTFEDLPAPVVHRAKRIVLDTLACALAARPYEAARVLERTMRSFGGEPQASIAGSPSRTSAPAAAFVNAEFANLLDLDDDLLN